jgi:hypothetical protein
MTNLKHDFDSYTAGPDLWSFKLTNVQFKRWCADNTVEVGEGGDLIDTGEQFKGTVWGGVR